MRLNQSKYHFSLRTAFVPLALLLGVMLTDTAGAVDGKEYPGSMCRESPLSGPAPGHLVFDTSGTALNRSTTSSIYVSCPLVRDADRQTGNITYAAVSMYKPNSAIVFCNLHSNPYFGGAGWFTSKTDQSPAGLRLLELPVRADPFVSGSFNISCLLQATVAGQKSGIYHYGIVEAD